MSKKVEYKSDTQGVEVSINPEYIDSQSIDGGQDVFVWAYHVVINNKSDDTLQLINRYWKIIDEDGLVQEISGVGAVGEQPILTPNKKFKYSSSVYLNNPSGIMGGHYGMRKSNGEIINIKIPTFSLDVPNAKTIVN
jgi:ApaG protein